MMTSTPSTHETVSPANGSQQKGPTASWLIESLFVLLLALLVFPYPFATSLLNDELTILSDGLRTFHGQVIYRDFFEFVTPLSPWVAAALFNLTGPSLFAARILQSLVMVLSGWQLYRLAGRLGVPAWGGMLPGLILILALYRKWPVFSHHWLHLPLILAALHLALTGLESQRARWWGGAGLMTGLAALCMQSDGVILAVALGGAAVADGLVNRKLRASLRHIGVMVGGIALPLASVFVYFAWQGALPDVWRNIVEFPLNQYKGAGGVNDLHFGGDFQRVVQPFSPKASWFAQFYHFLFLYALLPLASFIGVAWGGFLFLRGFRAAWWKPSDSFIFLLSGATLGFFALALKGRTDASHLAFYAYPGALLATLAAQGWWVYFTSSERRLLRWVPLFSLYAFALSGAMLWATSVQISWETLKRLRPPDEHHAASEAIRFLKENTLPSDRIVGLPHGEYFYFFGRAPASRFTFMLPSEFHYYSQAQFDALFREIALERPKYVLISGELGFPPYVSHMPANYRLVRTMSSPQYGMKFPLQVYALRQESNAHDHDPRSKAN